MEQTDINESLKDWEVKMKNDFQLFICRRTGSETSEELIKKAALAYGAVSHLSSSVSILRTESGKPYFSDSDIHFSISHSRDIWAALMGPACCGLDVQYIKPCAFDKIAGRFFSAAENRYIEKKGIDGFFDIWTAREACGKFSGEGFFGNFPDFVTEEGILKEIIEDCIIIRSDLGENLKCAWCVPLKYKDSCKSLKIREDF